MLLKKTLLGAADCLTLLPVTVVMLTLFHSLHDCPLFFWYWHLLKPWEIVQTEQIRVFYLLRYSDCYKEWTENLYQSNLSPTRGRKGKKKRGIGRLWHRVLKWESVLFVAQFADIMEKSHCQWERMKSDRDAQRGVLPESPFFRLQRPQIYTNS